LVTAFSAGRMACVTRQAALRLATSAMTRARGSHSEKVLPAPGTDTMSRRPWCRSITCLTMANPRPVPPVSRERLLSTR